MFFVDTIELSGLGNRSYLAGGGETAVVVDPPRDIDRVIAAAARRGVRIAHVVETHLHNDYVTGGLALARVDRRRATSSPRGPASPSTASRCATATTVDGRRRPAAARAGHARAHPAPHRPTCWRRTARRWRCSPAGRC